MRRRRGFSRAPRRNTNWLAGCTAAESIAAGSFTTFEVLEAATSGAELSLYLDPLLERLRGHIYLDPQFSAPANSQFAYVILNIWVGETSDAIVWDDDIGATLDAAMSDDSIIWTAGCRFGQYVRQDGTPSNAMIGLTQNTEVCNVDAKTRRRLEDKRRLYLTAINVASASNAAVELGFCLRALISNR